MRSSPLALIFFYAGLFFLPFDNIKFAPSAGWAAISPYLFFLSATIFVLTKPGLLLKYFSKIPSNAFLFFLIASIVTVISYITQDTYWDSIVFTYVKLFLGVCFYVSFLYFIELQPNWRYKFGRIIIYSYSVALLIGILQLPSALGIGQIIDFSQIFARVYPNKIQFSFTEPSFTSIHVFGILFFAALITLDIPSVRNKIIWLSVAIISLSVFSGSSLRVLVDMTLVATGLFFLIPVKRKMKLSVLIFIIGIVLYLFPPEKLMSRLEAFTNTEVALDPSSAIRKFRSQSALLGTAKDNYTTLFGFGFGNSAAAMRAGFSEAESDLQASYTEIEQLRLRPDGLTYSLHAKLFAELGVIIYLSLLIIIFDKRYKIAYLLILIVNLQFDSLAFYTIWFYFMVIYLSPLGSDKTILYYLSQNKKMRKDRFFTSSPAGKLN